MISILLFIKQNYKAALAVLFLALLAYGCAMTRAYTSEKAKRKDAEKAVNAAVALGSKSLFYANKKYHDDSLGWVTTTRSLVTDKENIASLAKSKEFYYLNLIKGIKPDKSNVISATEFEVKYDTFYLPVKPIALTSDTTIHKSDIFHWKEKDEWNDIDIYSIGKPKFKYDNEIKLAIFLGKRTKKFLFIRYGQREITTSIVPTNSRFSISKVNTIIQRK
jgi:hypothetical protein